MVRDIVELVDTEGKVMKSAKLEIIFTNDADECLKYGSSEEFKTPPTYFEFGALLETWSDKIMDLVINKKTKDTILAHLKKGRLYDDLSV